MKRPSVVVLVAAGALAVAASAIQAGPEKIAFPANYKDHVLYATLDRYDTKQYRELYGTPEAVRAAKEGKPIPSVSVLTLVQYKAQVDAQGNPVKDANGRFVKGEMVAFTVMEKRAGWGAEYPDERGRLASPDRVPEDPGAFPRAAQGPEPHADVSHAWHL